MTQEQLIEKTKQLIAIPSVAQDPAALLEALDFIAAMIWERCPDVTIERFKSNYKPGLLAYRGAQRPANFRIMLNGHLDVVPGKPEQYKAVVKDGKLYGRGVYDMKAACVVLTDQFCRFVNEVPYALGLQIVTDEESDGRNGTLYQIKKGVRADFIIAGECGRPLGTYEIANEAKGFVMAEIGFHGRAAHSAYPWKGNNAALRATTFINALHERFPVPLEASDETFISVTSLSAVSDAHSKLPDFATVKVVARYAAGDPNFRSRRHFAALIEEIDPTAEIVNILNFESPIYTNPQNPLLLSLKASAEKIERAEFSFVSRHGTGDGRFYGDVGDEACEFGIAGEDSHGDHEYITLEAFKNYRATLHDFLAKTTVTEKEHSNTRAFVG
ncbi:MAG TPA: M20/M25/M40 family metallo-hydrolase [Patescibacteria group bacterium]|nr:M20/M25/M40 family metallo-hydrolase [Patescibacteria group bacterium]